ncbi:hypothetical protein CGH86_22885 [Vibrio parahaemolyticus]|uniref:hypothetical protein n=1 Tax=Vibrio TaxID=662 RepID=UPI00111FB1A6|nr:MULTISPECIES: hypothetical protein [Vibrio]EIQ7476587.1 hypothetical protein [Vibrio parahaemolyticus]EJO3864617.1 hypothetical protein [Vibrio parahaemolyticus]ELB2264881.1 hypothetical protein [Vibrio parahaemolyticus]MCR9647298.1 hypothetical protein [Vibrio parahaemolyticus]MCR9797982.1 hypothetical protein [Vibrio parahaemolyticus]
MENQSLSWFGLEPSDVIAICALVVAFLSLAATFYQAHLSRNHNIISVQPYLDIFWSNTTLDGCKCYIKNHGVGAAYIESVNYFVNGKCYKVLSIEDLKGLIKEVTGGEVPLKIMLCYLQQHSALSPNEEAELFVISGAGEEVDVEYMKEYFESKLSSLAVQIEYKCSYKRNYQSIKSCFGAM